MGRCEPAHAVRRPALLSDGAQHACSAFGSLSVRIVLLLCDGPPSALVLIDQLKAAYACELRQESSQARAPGARMHTKCLSCQRFHACLSCALVHHASWSSTTSNYLLKLHATCSGTGGGGKPLPGISCGGQPRVRSRAALPSVACRLMCLSTETIQQHLCNSLTAQALHMQFAFLSICWQCIPCIILCAANQQPNPSFPIPIV